MSFAWSHDQFRNFKQAYKASFQLAVNGREPDIQSLLLKLLQQLQTEVDAFWATDKAKELMEQKVIMDKKYQEELTAFLSLKAKERKQRAIHEGASQGPTLPRADRARRPPSIEVAGESEGEAAWATEEEGEDGEEDDHEDSEDLSASLRGPTEREKNADSEEFDQRMKWKQEGKVGQNIC
ncbi:unnamed protein product [Penicillium discolor]